jgi:hypothetical protein
MRSPCLHLTLLSSLRLGVLQRMRLGRRRHCLGRNARHLARFLVPGAALMAVVVHVKTTAPQAAMTIDLSALAVF